MTDTTYICPYNLSAYLPDMDKIHIQIPLKCPEVNLQFLGIKVASEIMSDGKVFYMQYLKVDHGKPLEETVWKRLMDDDFPFDTMERKEIIGDHPALVTDYFIPYVCKDAYSCYPMARQAVAVRGRCHEQLIEVTLCDTENYVSFLYIRDRSDVGMVKSLTDNLGCISALFDDYRLVAACNPDAEYNEDTGVLSLPFSNCVGMRKVYNFGPNVKAVLKLMVVGVRLLDTEYRPDT